MPRRARARQRHVHRRRPVAAGPRERHRDRVEPTSYSSCDSATPSRRTRSRLAPSAFQLVIVRGVSAAYGSRPAEPARLVGGSCASRHLPSAVQCTGSRRPSERAQGEQPAAALAHQVDDLAPWSTARFTVSPLRSAIARRCSRASSGGSGRTGAPAAAAPRRARAAGGACPASRTSQPRSMSSFVSRCTVGTGARAAPRSPSASARASRRRTTRGCRGRGERADRRLLSVREICFRISTLGA